MITKSHDSFSKSFASDLPSRSDLKCGEEPNECNNQCERSKSDSDIALLSTSELLKRLLQSRPNRACYNSECNQRQETKKKKLFGKFKKNPKSDSCKSKLQVIQTESRANFFADKVNQVSQDQLRLSVSDLQSKISCSDGVLVSVPSSAANNGSMHHPVSSERETDTFGHGEDLPIIPQEILYNHTMDFLLAEAERTLCIQSPTSSVQTDSTDVEYTQLQSCPALSPDSGLPTAVERAKYHYGSMVEREVSVDSGYQTCPTDGSDLKSPGNCEPSICDENEEKEEEENDPMVLVPSNPEEWTSTHITSWLRWCVQKFSLDLTPPRGRFPDAGSELCLLTLADIEVRTSDARAAKLLHTHLQHLRHSATGKPLPEPEPHQDKDEKEGVDGSYRVITGKCPESPEVYNGFRSAPELAGPYTLIAMKFISHYMWTRIKDFC